MSDNAPQVRTYTQEEVDAMRSRIGIRTVLTAFKNGVTFYATLVVVLGTLVSPLVIISIFSLGFAESAQNAGMTSSMLFDSIMMYFVAWIAFKDSMWARLVGFDKLYARLKAKADNRMSTPRTPEPPPLEQGHNV